MDLETWVRVFVLIPVFPAAVLRYLLPKSSTEIFVEQLRKNELSPNERDMLTNMHLCVLPEREVKLFRSSRPMTVKDTRDRMMAINPVQEMLTVSKYVVLVPAAGFVALVSFLKLGTRWKDFIPDLVILNGFIFTDMDLRGGRVYGDMRKTTEYKNMVFGIGK